jgi:hypothetical protein
VWWGGFGRPHLFINKINYLAALERGAFESEATPHFLSIKSTGYVVLESERP